MPTAVAVADSARSRALVALRRANAVREARAELKAAVAAGEVTVAALLDYPPSSIETLAIGDLLCWQPRWGSARTGQLLRRAGIGELREVGRLTERQRLLLVELLQPRFAHPPRNADGLRTSLMPT